MTLVLVPLVTTPATIPDGLTVMSAVILMKNIGKEKKTVEMFIYYHYVYEHNAKR
jgi:hypothetical protein